MTVPISAVGRRLQELRALARAVLNAVHPATRRGAAEHRKTARQICAAIGRRNRKRLLSLPAGNGAVLVSQMFSPADVALQSVLLIALRMAGYRPVVILEARGTPWLARMYRFFGVKEFDYFEDVMPKGHHPDADVIIAATRSIDDLKGIVRNGIPVGTLALSTFMRRFRCGEVDLEDDRQRELFRTFLSESLRYAIAMDRLVKRWTPAAGITIDRGYTPQGHLFYGVLEGAGTCFTLNSSHRGGALIFKRYRKDNSEQHPSSLAPESWAWLKEMTWTPRHWDMLRTEIEKGYQNGEWYSAAGSQFRKRMLSPDEVRSAIGLDPGKPTAVIFPHMFWDASFTWGRDLFENYEVWFKQVLAVASRNENLNWVVKVHPANTTKNVRDGYKGEYSEIVALREICDPLPKHIFLLPPESEISTLSVYRVMDYCLTVRGTPGIEAPAFGKVALTAGTGRYDRHGFTRDSGSMQDYLARIERLYEEPRMTANEIELARRFAFGIFLMRPAAFSTLKFKFQRDAKASVVSSFDLPASGDIRDGEDVRAVLSWIQSGATDYLHDPMASHDVGEAVRPERPPASLGHLAPI